MVSQGTLQRLGVMFATLVSAGAVLSGCSSAGEPATVEDLGHIHALDATANHVLAATHRGVWTIDAAGLSDGFASDRTAPVGAGSQDTMGFTVAGPGLILASGHPDPDNNPQATPPALGLIRSVDNAKTWSPVALEGQIDFHDIVTAPVGAGNAHRVYGYDAARQVIKISSDTGRSWQDGATLALRKLAVNGNAPDTVLATTAAGVKISTDATATFTTLDGAPKLLLLSGANSAPGTFVGADVDGVIWTTSDTGQHWVQRGGFAAPPDALALVRGSSKDWLLGVDSGGIVATSDYGTTWTTLVPGKR